MKKNLSFAVLIALTALWCSCEKVTEDEKKDSYRVAVPEAVDLGLSVKWASFNLGADNPEGFGDYFAWGETRPKEDYSWATYKWSEGGTTTLTKYNTNSQYGPVDNKKKLDPEDDAAHVLLGGTWRMPTLFELEELMDFDNSSFSTYTSEDGVIFLKITSRKKGFTDNFILIPYSGYRSEKSTLYCFAAGNDKFFAPLWESNLCVSEDDAFSKNDNSLNAYYGWFGGGFVSENPWLKLRENRRYGLAIRPVCE